MEARTVTVDDGTGIYTEVHGKSGPVLCFVAGLGDNLCTWTSQVEALVDQFQIVLIDNRGSGNSTTPPGPYSTQRMADDAHQAILALGLGPVIAIGVSMGGAICQHWATRYPEDIERVVLSSTWSSPDVITGVLFNHWKGLAQRGDRQALIESLLVFCYSPHYLLARPETVSEFIQGETINLEGFTHAAVACCEHDAASLLKKIRQPVLVTIGEYDILIRSDLSLALARELPQSRIKFMSTGHMPSWETPVAYSQMVAEFARGE